MLVLPVRRCQWCDTAGYRSMRAHEAVCPLAPGSAYETCLDCDGDGYYLSGAECLNCGGTGAVLPRDQV